MARIGQPSQLIIYRSLKELSTTDCGPPIHSLIIVGEMHFMEEEVLEELSKVGRLNIKD